MKKTAFPVRQVLLASIVLPVLALSATNAPPVAAKAAGTNAPPADVVDVPPATNAPPAELRAIVLPPPDVSGGIPVGQALQARASTRAFSPRPLSPQQLSDVLWAAAGTNRPNGMRTAGSTRNFQAVSVYAILEEGIFRYAADTHSLEPVVTGDFRKLAGRQPFAATAPLNLLYVADFGRMDVGDRERQMLCLGVDAGLMGGNVYLQCASAGLATVIRGSVDNAPLAQAMGLPDGREVILAQSVGLPRTRPLVAYFSWGGNTRRAARAMAEAVGGDLYEIKPAKPYPADYQECVRQAGHEVRDGFRPELAGPLPDLSKYETVIVGSPNWWGTVSPPVAAFLEAQDFTGKTLAFFVTHGTGGMQRCADDAAKAARAPIALTGSWTGNDAKSLGDAFADWARRAVDIRP